MIDRRSILALGALPAFIAHAKGASAPVAQGGSASSLRSEAKAEVSLHGRKLKVVDLIHRLTKAFAFTPGRLSLEAVEGSGARVGMLLNRICMVEHTGTHLDAPRHFDAEGKSVGDLAIRELVVPLTVIDIRAKAEKDRDARLEADDILRWEQRHGRLPQGCCVAMNSGWHPLRAFEKYAELPVSERGKSPGFAASVAPLLVERGACGIAVDTLSLDAGGAMPRFPFHQSWLRSGRWGLEALANLDLVPPSGALLFVGAPPLAEATGIPVRAIALF